MSPLAKEIIEKLNNEKDHQVLAEVLDFYEYLKQKKSKDISKLWSDIDEDDPTDEEKIIYQEYNNSKQELIPLDALVKEFNLDGE